MSSRARSIQPTVLLLIVLGASAVPAPSSAQAQNDEATAEELTEHCRAAERFLVEDRGMVARVEPDTIQDWRTRQQLAGCRITAAGLTSASADLDDVATTFYERVRAAGWTRTPDPVDAPNEASLRFRMDASDCLFNFYSAGHLGTEADLQVSTEVVPAPGEQRYNIFVMCKPALEAAPRPA